MCGLCGSERVVLEYQLQNRVENLADVSTRASGRNVGKVFNPVLKLVFENYPFSCLSQLRSPHFMCGSARVCGLCGPAGGVACVDQMRMHYLRCKWFGSSIIGSVSLACIHTIRYTAGKCFSPVTIIILPIDKHEWYKSKINKVWEWV